MRIFIFLLLLIHFIFTRTYAQTVIIKATDYNTRKPIQGVQFIIENRKIATSNENGYAVIDKSSEQIKAIAPRYDTLFFYIGNESKNIYLYSQPIKREVKQVIIAPVIDSFATNLVYQSIKNKKKNSIASIPNYQFYYYTKLLLDSKYDSMAKVILKDAKDRQEDSLDQLWMKDHALFYWERLFREIHTKEWGTKTILMSSHMSGIKLPLYDFIVSSYEINKTPSLFTSEKVDDYVYRFEDSLNYEGKKIYHISFFRKNLKRYKKRIHGFFYLDADNKSLAKYIGENDNAYIELNSFPIGQIWVNKDIYVQIQSENSMVNNRKMHGTYIVRADSFVRDISFKKSDFDGYEIELSQKLNSPCFDSIMNRYRRTDSMTKREIGVDSYVQTIVKKEKIEAKLGILSALTNDASIKFKNINISIPELFSYNKYEGVRPCLSIKTNKDFDKKWTIGGFLAYGIKDHSFKYGANIDFLIHYQRQTSFGIQYQNTKLALGRNYSILSSSDNLLSYYVNLYYFRDLYQTQSLVGYFQSDIHKYLTLKTSFQWSQIRYLPNTIGELYANGPEISYLISRVECGYTPGTKYFVTPVGKRTYSSKPTKIYSSLEYYYDVTSSLSHFLKCHFSIESSWKTIFGKTTVNASLNKIFGQAPLFAKSEGMGTASDRTSWQNFLSLGTNLSFHTMSSSSFYSDQSIRLYIHQHLPTIYLSKTKKIDLLVSYNSLLGSNAIISNDATIPPSKFYQELGIECMHLYSVIGLGAYYRLGAYTESDFYRNAALSLKIGL